ncbi:MAG: hypothetical protein ABDH37_07040 [Candidatus Hydrothermales bacterium]
MRNFKKLCFLMFFTTTIFYGQQEKIDLVPIYEKTFKDTIVDLIFEEVEVTVKEAKSLGVKGLEDKSDEEKISFPEVKVIITEKEVKFLDKKGKVKKKINIGYKDVFKVNKSKNEKFIGIKVLENNDKTKAKFMMFNKDGKKLWEINEYLYNFVVSPDGKYVIEIPSIEYGHQAPLRMLGSKGLIKEIPKPHISIGIDFSENGEYVVIGLNNRKKKEGYLLLIDRYGEELWRHTVGTAVGAISISPTGKFISGIGSQDTLNILFVFDKIGNLIFTYSQLPKIGNIEMKFDENSNLLLLTSTEFCGYLFDLSKSKLIWKYEPELKTNYFRGAIFSGNFNTIIFLSPGYHGKSYYLYIVNKEGKEILVKELGIKKFITHFCYSAGMFKPYVILSKDGNYIYGGKIDGVEVYRIKGEVK